VDETRDSDEAAWAHIPHLLSNPASPEAQVAEPLRAVAGLGTEDIASSFLVSPRP